MTVPSAHPLYPEITRQVVNDLLKYDPKTGALTWRHYRGPKAAAGSLAGMIHQRSGTVLVTIFGHKIPASHLVYMITRNRWPTEKLFPRDKDQENLRSSNWVEQRFVVDPAPHLAKRRAAYKARMERLRNDPNRPDDLVDRELDAQDRLTQRMQAAEDTTRHPVTHRKRRTTRRAGTL